MAESHPLETCLKLAEQNRRETVKLTDTGGSSYRCLHNKRLRELRYIVKTYLSFLYLKYLPCITCSSCSGLRGSRVSESLQSTGSHRRRRRPKQTLREAAGPREKYKTTHSNLCPRYKMDEEQTVSYLNVCIMYRYVYMSSVEKSNVELAPH